MWKAVETGTRKVRMGEAEGRRGKGRKRKKRRGRRRGEQWKLGKWQKNGNYGTRKKRQQGQRQRRKSWFRKNSISRLRSSARNSRREYLQGRFGIMR